MQQPFLSIITCTYNSAAFLEDTIRSVEKQNLDSSLFEHIFVDANSTDNTLHIIADYQKRNPSYTIKIVSQKPKGIYNAMNIGIEKSRGRYILFLHSDDFLVPDVMSAYIAFIQETWCRDFYFAQRYNYIQRAKKTAALSEKITILPYLWMSKIVLWFTVYISQPTVLHHRDIFKKFWSFDENYKIISDMTFYSKICGKVSYKYYPHIMTNFRIHEQSTSTSSTTHTAVIKEISHYVYQYYPRPIAFLMIMYNIFYYRFLLKRLFYRPS